MKFAAKILLLLVMSITGTLAQTVSFSAVDSATGSPIQLDTVVIFNHGTQTRVVLTDDYSNVNLGLLTGVPYDAYSDTKNQKNIICENGLVKTAFLSADAPSPITVTLIDLNGRKELEKQFIVNETIYYDILIPFNGLPRGIHLLKIQSLNNIETRLILNISSNNASANADINSIEIEKNPDILVNTGYTFIGISRGYFPDTLDITNPYDGMQIKFKMKKLSIWTVRKCKFYFKSLSDMEITTSQQSGPDLYTTTRRDTIPFEFKTDFQNTIFDHGYCDTNNRNNHIIIRHCELAGWPIEITFEADIDTITFKLNNISLSYYTNRLINESRYVNINVLTHFNTSIPSIPCDSISYDYISAKIYLKDLGKFNLSYTEYKNYLSNRVHTIYTRFMSIMPDPDAYISIILSR